MPYEKLTSGELVKPRSRLNRMTIKPTEIRLSASLVDYLKLETRQQYEVSVDREIHRLRLVPFTGGEGKPILATAKAGGCKTAGKRDNLIIRAEKLFAELGITKTIITIPLVGADGSIVIDYGEALNESQ